MSIPKVTFVVFICAFALSSFSLIATTSAISENEAILASNNADETLALAYMATLEAEEAGADISNLLIQIDEAGVLLARAHMSYRSGDFDEALHSANSARSIGEEVQDAAAILKVMAQGESDQRLLFWVGVSIVGVLLTVFGSFFGWKAFKRRYYKRVLKMKPEVASNEP